jgi:hypothetical protein
MRLLVSKIRKEGLRYPATLALLALATLANSSTSFARDIEYSNSEVVVFVKPGEPTQVQFPGDLSGGFKKKGSSLSIDQKDTDLIVYATERIPADGEAIIVRLKDGRSYSLRIKKSGEGNQRDDVIRIEDGGNSILGSEDGEVAVDQKSLSKAPPTHIAGLMREMMLVAEFGKGAIPGYRETSRYQGQTVLNDGTVEARIDRIFIGPNLWGYVVDTKNLLDQSQRLNPASFRLDGTRAIAAQNWELSPRPLNIEEQVSGKHDTKVYIVTRPR